MDTEKKGVELTFSDILVLLKKSWIRIVIYVLIFVIVVGGISVGVMIGTSGENSYKAMVTFNYEGIEDGLDPWGGALDISKIKADSIIIKALEQNGYVEDNENRTKIKNNIIKNISISGVVPEDTMEQILIIKDIATKDPTQLKDLIGLSYYSTSFVITLTKSDAMDFGKNEYLNILNSIIDEYVKDFKIKYGFSDVLGTAIAGEIDIDKYDYIELVNLYETQLNEMISYIDERILEDSDFRATETKLSFVDMKNRLLKIRDYDLKQLQTFVFKEGLTKDDVSVHANTYIDEKLKGYDREIAKQEALIDTVAIKQDVNNTPDDETDDVYIMNFEPHYNTTKTPDGTTMQELANGEDYTALLEKFTSYQAKLAELNNLKTLWTERQSSFGTGATEDEKLIGDSMINELDMELKNETEIINAGVQDYIDNEVMKDAVSKSVSATAERKDNLSYSLLASILIVTAIIAILIAICVTHYKDKKYGTKVEAEIEKKEE